MSGSAKSENLLLQKAANLQWRVPLTKRGYSSWNSVAIITIHRLWKSRGVCAPLILSHILHLCEAVYFITFYFKDEGKMESMYRINKIKKKGGSTSYLNSAFMQHAKIG